MPRREILPALQTVGALYPHTLILELPLHARGELERSLAGGRDNEPARVYAHELHHWFDVVGSLWGQRYLDLVFAAFDAMLAAPKGGEDAAYPEALALFDADRAILSPRYYKYVLPGARHGTDRKWRVGWSMGNRIGPDGRRLAGEPLLFVRFDAGPAHIARQPLSVGALLELRAMATEEAVFQAFVGGLGEEAVVERAFRDREHRDVLYDPMLTTYSVAAHVLSTNSGIVEVGAVFAWAGVLGRLCLNLQPSITRKLVAPGPFAAFGKPAVHALKARADPGFAFACVVLWLRENAGPVLDDSVLDRALAGVGLPGRAEIVEEARRTLYRRPEPRIRSARLSAIRRALSKAGAAVLAQDAAVLPQAEWEGLPSPVVMTVDCKQFHLGLPTLSVADCEWLHDLQVGLDDLTRQALRAGRGLDFGYTDFTY